MNVRILTPIGIEQFQQYLMNLRGDPLLAVPTHLLTDSSTSAPLPGGATVEERRFATKLEASQYLQNQLSAIPRADVERNPGLWAWLALLYFDQLAPADASGRRKVRELAKYIPSENSFREYRHLLQGPYKLYLAHEQTARVLLTKPLSVWSDLEEQMIGVQELTRMPGAMEAADLLYFDPVREEAKRGATNRNKPGTIRRFGAIVQQLDLTYDLHSMRGVEILGLLPSEFDRFRR